MAQSFRLTPYQWQNRVVLLFAPSAQDETYLSQKAELEVREAGVDERDLVVVSVFMSEGEVEDRMLSKEDVAALRQRFGVPESGFSFILIGKDGGVKRRAAEIVGTDELFGQIDSMPMRQREMREGN